MLKRELIRLLEEDQEFRDIARAKLGIADFVQTLERLAQSLATLANEVREQGVANKSLAEACLKVAGDMARLGSLIEREVELLQAVLKSLDSIARSLETLTKGQTEVLDSIRRGSGQIIEALQREEETLKRLLMSL